MIKLNEFDKKTVAYFKLNFENQCIKLDCVLSSELGKGLKTNSEDYNVINKITELIDFGNLSVDDKSVIVNFLKLNSKEYNPEIIYLINFVNDFPDIHKTILNPLNSEESVLLVIEEVFLKSLKLYINILAIKTFLNTIYGNINSNGIVDIRRGKNIFKKEVQVVIDNQDKSYEELSDHKDFLFIALVGSLQKIFQDLGISDNIIKSGFNISDK